MKFIDSQTNTKKVVDSKKKKRVHKKVANNKIQANKLANNKIQANEYVYHTEDFTPLAVGFLGENGLKRWANSLKRGGK